MELLLYLAGVVAGGLLGWITGRLLQALRAPHWAPIALRLAVVLGAVALVLQGGSLLVLLTALGFSTGIIAGSPRRPRPPRPPLRPSRGRPRRRRGG